MKILTLNNMETKTTNFVIEFDYNLEALNAIKSEVLAIDKGNISEVENAVKQLVKVRRAIQTKGKSYRDEANAFNKTVLDKEKEYVGIIEPVEIEYKELLEKEEQRKVIEARKGLLPSKKKQLAVLKVLQPTDEEILALNEEEWVAFLNTKLAEHEQTLLDEARIEQEQKVRKEREEQIKKDAEERAKIEQAEALKKAEEDKIKAVEAVKKEAELKELREKQAREDEARREQEAKEAKQKAEAEAAKKMEADKKYQNWLKQNGYTEETKTDFVLEKVGNKVRLSKIIGIFSLENN